MTVTRASISTTSRRRRLGVRRRPCSPDLYDLLAPPRHRGIALRHPFETAEPLMVVALRHPPAETYGGRTRQVVPSTAMAAGGETRTIGTGICLVPLNPRLVFGPPVDHHAYDPLPCLADFGIDNGRWNVVSIPDRPFDAIRCQRLRREGSVPARGTPAKASASSRPRIARPVSRSSPATSCPRLASRRKNSVSCAPSSAPRSTRSSSAGSERR